MWLGGSEERKRKRKVKWGMNRLGGGAKEIDVRI